VALVFGGSRGIGAAIARRLAHDGFDVALTYVSRPDKAQEVVSAIEAGGGKALAIDADSTDPQALRAAVTQTTERFGPLDVAVVNAGVFRMGPIDTFSVEDLDLLISVNVRGVYLAIQAAVAGMRDGGRIVTIGSNVAIRTGMPGASAYAMTKGAVATLVRNVALDLAPRRITVNDVQPGPTETDMTAGVVDQIVARVPLGRVGQPEEIAGLVSYLAGSESGYMTGANLTIDGGFVL
jgi:3-oxoacyl-[acyl-carrier protein] reductase